MTTFQLGVLGYPLGHSLSPVLHRHFLDVTGLAGSYEPFAVPPEHLSDWLASSKTRQLTGFNVTIPFKTQIVPFLKELSTDAEFIGAANTVLMKPDGYEGRNTDAYGFIAPLSPERLAQLPGSHAVILGAGGASRAVAYALLKKGVGQLTFLVRNPESATATLKAVHEMNAYYRGAEVPIYVRTQADPALLADVRWLINTTPVGMTPNTGVSPFSPKALAGLPSDALVYDLVYNPVETRLLSLAHARGLATQDGLDMLIHQGAKAFQLWTGVALSAEALHAARPLLLQP